mgnify:CR=1 FL=1
MEKFSAPSHLCVSALKILLPSLTLTLQAFDSRSWLAERADDSGKTRLEEAYAQLKDSGGLPAEDVSLPIERFDDGRVRAKLHAARAWMFTDSDCVIGEDVKVERFKDDGTVEVAISAESVIADRKAKTLLVPGEAKLAADMALATGREVYFSFGDETLRVYKATRIVTKALNLKLKDVVK